MFSWDVLQRNLKNELPVNAHGIPFLPVAPTDSVPYDLLMVIGLHGIWKSCVAVWHANVNARPVCHYFAQSISQIRELYKDLGNGSDWLPILDELVTLRSC